MQVFWHVATITHSACMVTPLTATVCQSSKYEARWPHPCMYVWPLRSQKANIKNKVGKWRYWTSRWHPHLPVGIRMMDHKLHLLADTHLCDSFVPTNNDLANTNSKLKMLDSIKRHPICCKPSNIRYTYMITFLWESFSITRITCGPQC